MAVFADHREVPVRFICARATLAGTLYLPRGAGRHPAAVWVHGSGPSRRLGFAKGVLPALVRSGVAILSWDKRGVGASTGTCCPGDRGHFNLLAADADVALNALRERRDIERRHIGIVGASQAGWIVPWPRRASTTRWRSRRWSTRRRSATARSSSTAGSPARRAAWQAGCRSRRSTGASTRQAAPGSTRGPTSPG